jgi:hypothetical protein
MKLMNKLNEVPIMRFTYGLACIAWVLITMGLAWLAANADERVTDALRAQAETAALAQPSELSAPDRSPETVVRPAPSGKPHAHPATRHGGRACANLACSE